MRKQITPEIAVEMRTMKEAGDSFKRIGDQFGVHWTTVYKWIKRAGWK
jgi:transposase